jgi:hypothetical protein
VKSGYTSRARSAQAELSLRVAILSRVSEDCCCGGAQSQKTLTLRRRRRFSARSARKELLGGLEGREKAQEE